MSVYIATEYKKFNDNKYLWYAKKWGNAKDGTTEVGE